MREIKIDFDNLGLPQRLDVVENDAQSRFFKAVLYKDGKAYAAPSGATYSIMYRGFGPQNEGWYDTINDGAGKRAACSVSGNVVTCEIARQALRVPGHVSVVLCVTGSNGYMLHGWPIDCNCRNDNYTGGTSVESFFYITQVTNADWTSAIQTWEELKNMIDPTLSLSGKAADAAKVGEAVGEIKEDLVDYTYVKRINEWTRNSGVNGGYIPTNTSVVNISNIVTAGDWSCVVMPCKKGDFYTIKGQGGLTPRLWCFADNNYNVISVAPAYYAHDVAFKSYGNVIVSPSDGYLIVNEQTTHEFSERSLYYGIAKSIISYENNIINIKDLGAKADGLTDDSYFFKKAFELTKYVDIPIYIPSGKYKVTDSLGVVNNVKLYGDKSDSSGNSGTVILDSRQPMESVNVTDFLIELTGKYDVRNIAFFSNDETDNGILNNCLKLDGGWDSHIANICVNNYLGRGISVYGEDITLDTVFINACGTKADVESSGNVAYGLTFTNGANNNHITNCHIEHCRFALQLAEARNNIFVSLKVEQYKRGITANSNHAPLRIYANSSGNIFNACFFVSMSKDSYELSNVSPVYFIDIENGYQNIFNSCVFKRNKLDNAIGNALYIKDETTNANIITSNVFDNMDKSGLITNTNDIVANNILSVS